MKELLLATLSIVGAVGTVIGKWGFIISIIAWIVGLLGLITYVSAWWFVSFGLLYIVSWLTAATSIVLVQ